MRRRTWLVFPGFSNVPSFFSERRSDNIDDLSFEISLIFALNSTRSVVILHGMYLRTVKVRSSSGTVNEYVRVVEAYRDNGKVKQRTLADLGRKDLLVEIFPKLQRLLGQATGTETTQDEDLDILDASTWGPVLAVRALFDQLGLWAILDATLGKAKGVPFADRAFVLIANRLIHPASEHGLAGWLETDFVCDRQGRRFVPHWHQHNRVRVHFSQLEAWYRTLDQLWPPRNRSRWPSITASVICSASSRTWCSTTSPAPTSRVPGRPTSPSTATAETASRTTSR